MGFYWKRYRSALTTYRHWLWLAALPALLYWALAAAQPDRFSVVQEFRVHAPHTVTANHLMPYLTGRIPLADPDGRNPVVRPTAQRTLHLSPAGPGRMELIYLGEDPRNGRELVHHYAEKLLREAELGAPLTGVTVEAAEDLRTAQHRALWRADRWPSLLRFLVGGLVLALALVGVREALDPALKSERQATRYLGIPLLGTVPKIKERPRAP